MDSNYGIGIRNGGVMPATNIAPMLTRIGRSFWLISRYLNATLFLPQSSLCSIFVSSCVTDAATHSTSASLPRVAYLPYISNGLTLYYDVFVKTLNIAKSVPIRSILSVLVCADVRDTLADVGACVDSGQPKKAHDCGFNYALFVGLWGGSAGA